jgi:hypothetical protein
MLFGLTPHPHKRVEQIVNHFLLSFGHASFYLRLPQRSRQPNFHADVVAPEIAHFAHLYQIVKRLQCRQVPAALRPWREHHFHPMAGAKRNQALRLDGMACRDSQPVVLCDGRE